MKNFLFLFLLWPTIFFPLSPVEIAAKVTVDKAVVLSGDLLNVDIVMNGKDEYTPDFEAFRESLNLGNDSFFIEQLTDAEKELNGKRIYTLFFQLRAKKLGEIVWFPGLITWYSNKEEEPIVSLIPPIKAICEKTGYTSLDPKPLLYMKDRARIEALLQFNDHIYYDPALLEKEAAKNSMLYKRRQNIFSLYMYGSLLSMILFIGVSIFFLVRVLYKRFYPKRKYRPNYEKMLQVLLNTNNPEDIDNDWSQLEAIFRDIIGEIGCINYKNGSLEELGSYVENKGYFSKESMRCIHQAIMGLNKNLFSNNIREKGEFHSSIGDIYKFFTEWKKKRSASNDNF